MDVLAILRFKVDPPAWRISFKIIHLGPDILIEPKQYKFMRSYNYYGTLNQNGPHLAKKSPKAFVVIIPKEGLF